MLKKSIGVFCLSLLAGCASQLQRGADDFAAGHFDQAAAKWNPLANGGDPFAQYNLGLLWEQGLGRTPKNVNQASHWFLLSAKQGYVPAMVRLARIQRSAGLTAPAESWLTLAARWGDTGAVSELRTWGKLVPPQDLLAAKRARDTVAQQQAIESLSQAAYTIGSAIGSGGRTIQPIQPLASPYAGQFGGAPTTFLCGVKPIPNVGCNVGRCINGRWEQICQPVVCGIPPIPSVGCSIGRCVGGRWEQLCETFVCGIRPVASVGCFVDRCMNGSWEQVCG